MRLAAHPGGLSDAQRAALADLAARWQAAGGGVVLIREPLKGADPKAIYAAGMASEAALIASGVPAGQVRRVGYDPDGEGPAPVIVGFEAYAAVVPACGRRWDNLTATASNKPYTNFGCAISANMAAEIANPADIAAQHPVAPADAQRFSNAVEQYRAGPSSSSGSSSGTSGGVERRGQRRLQLQFQFRRQQRRRQHDQRLVQT